MPPQIQIRETMIDELPDEIKVDSSFLKKKPGRKTDIERRRLSTPVKGKVKGKREYYTDKEKLKVVCTYAVSGNSRRVAELTGVSEATIRSWKQTEWWNEVMSRIVTEQDEELGVKLTGLIDKAVAGVNERLDNGDWVYNAKLDKLIRKPINAKDLAVVTAITVDKRQLLRGQPTSRIEKVSVDERLKKLGQQFEQFARAKEIIQDQDIDLIEQEEEFHSDIEEDWEEENQEELTVNELFSEDA